MKYLKHEIGIPLDNIEVSYDSIKEITELPVYDGGFEIFFAIGDEEGMFICITKNIKDWFPIGETACASPFKLKMTEKGLE